ncbi:hypothetical protein ACFLRF_05485, partial [Candidatus Altiarchaeota archaeon]
PIRSGHADEEGVVLALSDSGNIMAGDTTGKLYLAKPPSRSPTESFLMAATLMIVVIAALVIFRKSWGSA